jgi:hypothetical protein
VAVLTTLEYILKKLYCSHYKELIHVYCDGMIVTLITLLYSIYMSKSISLFPINTYNSKCKLKKKENFKTVLLNRGHFGPHRILGSAWIHFSCSDLGVCGCVGI